MFKRLKDAVKVLLGRSKAVSLVYRKTAYSCPVCKNDNVHFSPLPFRFFREMDKNQFIHSIFQTETLNIEFYSCSLCGASDRDRLYALYFNKVLTKEKELKILDIAPAKSLTSFLKSFPNYKVRTTDLFMDGVDDAADITNMPLYADESFDVFICSHVLEHIEEDMAAIKELYRILKKDGWGIAMVPINLGLKENYENDSIKDEAGRWKHFGQDDHVRMYSKTGFKERLQTAGFNVYEYGINYFGAEVFENNGIHLRSVLYVVRK